MESSSCRRLSDHAFGQTIRMKQQLVLPSAVSTQGFVLQRQRHGVRRQQQVSWELASYLIAAELWQPGGYMCIITGANAKAQSPIVVAAPCGQVTCLPQRECVCASKG